MIEALAMIAKLEERNKQAELEINRLRNALSRRGCTGHDWGPFEPNEDCGYVEQTCRKCDAIRRFYLKDLV